MKVQWSVTFEPEGANPGAGDENTGGLIVYLTDGEDRQEVTRVAYVREISRHPDVSFAEQLAVETEKAQQACDAINDALDEADRNAAEAIMRTRERVREILGEPTKVPA